MRKQLIICQGKFFLSLECLLTHRKFCVRYNGWPLPQWNDEEAEVEWFYEDPQDLLELTPKKDVLFITGDWNAKIGSQETPGVTGEFGLGIWNEAEQRLLEFCQENALVITNTLFQQHKRRLYTWTSPDGQHQNQIDYILCSDRWRRLSYLFLLFFGTLHSDVYIFPFLLCFLLVFFSQLFVRSPQTAILVFCISFPWGWSWSLSPIQCHEPHSIVHQALYLSDLGP